MIETPDQDLRKRVNTAITNIRFIATRAKRANVLQATQKAEMVVSMLNEFRQYVDAVVKDDKATLHNMPFQLDQPTMTRVIRATMQADDTYNLLARTNKKKYEDEHRQVWSLLENIHTYIEKQAVKGVTHATK